jgi:glutamate/tyrosine decarboxylase-like PLP-dependent enzyme
MDIEALEALLREGDVGTVVATMGNTGLGAVDGLPEIIALQSEYGYRIHADAAYGGYFTLARLLHDDTRAAYDSLAAVDSIVIDPHKHGLQPYGCGCILFKDPSVGQLYKHESPFTYFSSAELHLGEISLECSRPGAAAVALWATQQLLPLVRGGDFAAMLDDCLKAAENFWKKLRDSEYLVPLMEPELDIIVYAVDASDSSTATDRAQKLFAKAAEHDLHLALIELPVDLVRHYAPELRANSETVTCLRSVLMKPEHCDWLERIVGILETSAAEIA